MATPPKRGGNAPLFGARIAEGAAGDSDGPRAPCSALDPPQTLPLSRSAWPVRKAVRLEGIRCGRQARVGRHDPETDFGMIPLPTPHHHQTGSATRSGGCHAIAQKGVAKAFCCAGSMMTADGGWERLLWRVACTPGNAPFRGLPTTAPSSMVKQSSGEWGAERTRDRAFSLGFGP